MSSILREPNEEYMIKDATETYESQERNKEWESLEQHLGDITNLVRTTVRHNYYLLEMSDAIDKEDIEQEALGALLISWREKSTKDEKYTKYLNNLKKSEDEVDMDSPRVFAGYARTKMNWEVVKNMRSILGRPTSENRKGIANTFNETSMVKEDEEEFDLFERLSLASSNTNPSIYAITRHDFEELFGIINSKVDAQELRQALYETAYNVMEKSQMEISTHGSGNYRKAEPTAQANRKAAFYTLYMAPAIDEQITLKQAAEKFHLDYEALKKEAKRLPGYLFALKDQITVALKEKIKAKTQ